MKNPSQKIQEALFIIRKFNQAINVERTNDEDTVYLFDYSTNKKTIGSVKISKAVEKAVKQQDFPKQVVYSDGMLTILKEPEIIEPIELFAAEIETENETEVEPETEQDKPKKRGRKKQSDLDA